MSCNSAAFWNNPNFLTCKYSSDLIPSILYYSGIFQYTMEERHTDVSEKSDNGECRRFDLKLLYRIYTQMRDRDFWPNLCVTSVLCTYLYLTSTIYVILIHITWKEYIRIRTYIPWTTLNRSSRNTITLQYSSVQLHPHNYPGLCYPIYAIIEQTISMCASCVWIYIYMHAYADSIRRRGVRVYISVGPLFNSPAFSTGKKYRKTKDAHNTVVAVIVYDYYYD